MPDTDTFPTDTELLELIGVTPWRRSPGWPAGVKDGKPYGAVSGHEYIVRDKCPELFDLLDKRIRMNDAAVWRGRYQPGGYLYRYLTLPDGLTYWRMREPIINRDVVDRTAREERPR